MEKSWPDKLSKDNSNVDLWLKEIAPTKNIDEWVTDGSVDFDEFKKGYRNELQKKKRFLQLLGI